MDTGDTMTAKELRKEQIWSSFTREQLKAVEQVMLMMVDEIEENGMWSDGMCVEWGYSIAEQWADEATLRMHSKRFVDEDTDDDLLI